MLFGILSITTIRPYLFRTTNYDSVAMGRLPYKVTQDPMVTPLREFGYLPEGVIDPHDLPIGSQRAGKRPEEINLTNS